MAKQAIKSEEKSDGGFVEPAPEVLISEEAGTVAESVEVVKPKPKAAPKVEPVAASAPPAPYLVQLDEWRAELRERSLAGTLRDLSASFVMPIGRAGDELTVDMWGIYTVKAKCDGENWFYWTEINP